MTPTQRRLARHALGLPNEANCSYRNRYTAPNSDISESNMAWLEMVGLGLAERGPKALTQYFCFYRLTRTGAELALDPGERLDEEDF